MSTAPIRTIVAADDAIDRRTLESVLSDPGIEVVAVVESHGEMLAQDVHDVDAMLVACNGHPDVALAYVAEATRDCPQWPVVVVTTSSPSGLMREVFEAGADDILTLDDPLRAGSETFFALQKAVARRISPATDIAAGQLICVLGPKGGAGKTTTVTNLGCALAESGQRTLVVDLDLQFGDLGLTLGVRPDRTIYDLATSGGSLDDEKLDAYLVRHPSGLQVLMAPTRPDRAGNVTADFLRDLYPVLRGVFDVIVVDTPPGFTPEVIATIDASTSICMVGMLDAPSLKNTRLGLDTLELMGLPTDKIRIVLNRADTNVGVTHADVVRILGRAPDVLVPSSRDVVRSVNAGEPIVLSGKRSEPAKAFRALAELYVSAAAPPARPAGGRRSIVRGRGRS